MNHTITVGGLLLAVGVMGGLLAALFGALMFFAAGMSDAGDDGTGGKGCALFAGGLVVCIGCILGLVL